MRESSARLKWVVVALIAAGWLVPILAYHIAIGRVPAISATDAVAAVQSGSRDSVLVDIRTPEVFALRHVRGSVNWPLGEITAGEVEPGLAKAVAGKEVHLLCNSGLYTAIAFREMPNFGVTRAVMVHDGLAAYNVIGGLPIDEARMQDIYGGASPMPWYHSPWYEQWSLFLTGFVVKPAYMLLSFLLILLLWGQRAWDMAALRWGLIFFLAGEFACMVNYVIFRHASHLSEFSHGYGMVVAFGFLTYAAMEGLDARVIHFSSAKAKCAFMGMCPSCEKGGGGICGLRRLIKFLVVAVLVVTPLLFCAQPSMVSYNTKILLSMYNFSHPAVYQIFEARICPAVAMLLLGLSLVALSRTKDPALQWPKMLFAAGFGAFGFGLFRVALFGIFKGNLVWFNTWEEVTEMILVAGIALLLVTFPKLTGGKRGSFDWLRRATS